MKKSKCQSNQTFSTRKQDPSKHTSNLGTWRVKILMPLCTVLSRVFSTELLLCRLKAQLISYWTKLWTRASSQELFVLRQIDFKTKISRWCTIKQIIQWDAHEKSANWNFSHQETDTVISLSSLQICSQQWWKFIEQMETLHSPKLLQCCHCYSLSKFTIIYTEHRDHI